jgi:hypothetical protein
MPTSTRFVGSTTDLTTDAAFDTSGQPVMLGRVTDLRRRLAVPAVALALLVGGCSDEGDDDGSPEPAGQAASSTLRQRPAGLDVEIARLAGALPKAEARDLTKRLGRVVATWFDGGFVAGDYPRQSFSGYASFTDGAARLARRSAAVTTNVRLGRQWVDAVPTRQRVRLFVFAPGHRPSGATAEVELVMAGVNKAGSAAELAVTGKLYLTKANAGWRIFGFDLHRSVGKPGDYAARQRALREQQKQHKSHGNHKPQENRDRPKRDTPRSNGQEGRR